MFALDSLNYRSKPYSIMWSRLVVNGKETSSELIVCINALVVEVVLEETSLVFVEESRRKRKL